MKRTITLLCALALVVFALGWKAYQRNRAAALAADEAQG